MYVCMYGIVGLVLQYDWIYKCLVLNNQQHSQILLLVLPSVCYTVYISQLQS